MKDYGQYIQSATVLNQNIIGISYFHIVNEIMFDYVKCSLKINSKYKNLCQREKTNINTRKLLINSIYFMKLDIGAFHHRRQTINRKSHMFFFLLEPANDRRTHKHSTASKTYFIVHNSRARLPLSVR